MSETKYCNFWTWKFLFCPKDMKWPPVVMCLCYHPLKSQLWVKPSSQPVCHQLHVLPLCQLTTVVLSFPNPACDSDHRGTLPQWNSKWHDCCLSPKSLQRRHWAVFWSTPWLVSFCVICWHYTSWRDMLCNLTCEWSSSTCADKWNKPVTSSSSVSEITASEILSSFQ